MTAGAGTTADDPIDAAALRAWLNLVKGTWSESDWKIYLAGYREGWLERGRAIQEAVEDSDATRLQRS